MKKILTYLLFVSFSVIAFSQPYQKMLSDSVEWNANRFDGLWLFENIKSKITGDTLIDSVDYKILESVGRFDSARPPTSISYNFLREDTSLKKVYLKRNNLSEILIYDFSKNVGDTLIIQKYKQGQIVSDSLVLDSTHISTSFYNNKVYYLTNLNGYFNHLPYDQLVWGEGIGSFFYLIESAEPNHLSPQNHDWNYFRMNANFYEPLIYCVKKNAQSVFNYPYYYNFQGSSTNTSIDTMVNCTIADMFITSINNPKMESLKVYPNPANKTIHFFENKVGNVTIMNIKGEKLLESYLKLNDINISQLKSGVYIALVEVEGEKYSSKFIKR